MKLALGYSLNIKDLFRFFKTSKLKLTAKKCEQILKNRHKEKIAQRVFIEAVKLVVDDIIENNNSFKLPTGARDCLLHMKRYSGDKFKERRRLGKWKAVDYFKTIYTGYQMEFCYQYGKTDKYKIVYLDPTHRDRIDEQTNNLVAYY